MFWLDGNAFLTLIPLLSLLESACCGASKKNGNLPNDRLISRSQYGQGHMRSDPGLFEKVIDNKWFVDKTLLLKLVPGDDFDHVQFIQAPSQFGKSTALSMIKTFFEISVNSKGERIEPKTETANYQLFQKIPRHLQVHLAITKDEKFMDTYFGEYPVLHLSFKGVTLIAYNEHELARTLLESVRESFEGHRFLLHSNACPDRARLDLYLNSDKIRKRSRGLLVVEVRTVVGDYLECLCKHFKKAVLVLVDEFDTPITKTIKSSSPIDLEIVSDDFDTLIGDMFKDNPYVAFAVLAGITRYSDVYSWGAPRIDHKSVYLEKEYAPYFGLNDTEVKSLCKSYDQSELYPEIKHWFDGYSVAGCEWTVFSTISVIDSLEKGAITPGWTNLGIGEELGTLFRFENLGESVWEALQDKPLRIWVDTKISTSEIKDLKTAIGLKKFKETDKSLVLHYLAQQGFFGLSRGTKPVNTLRSRNVRITIPNLEIKKVLCRRVWEEETKHYSNIEPALRRLYNSLLQLQPTKKSSQNVVDSFASLLQVFSGSRNIEQEFQAILYLSTIYCSEYAKELRVSYWSTSNNDSLKKLKIARFGQPGKVEFVFLRPNPYVNGQLTYTMFVFDFKYGSMFTVEDAQTQCNKSNFTLAVNSKIISDGKVTDYVLIPLHANQEMEVTGRFLFNSKDPKDAIFVESKP